MNGKTKDPPAFLLAGGRPLNASGAVRLMARAFEGIPSPSVAYVGTANGDSAVFFAMIKSLLTKAGAGRVTPVKLAKNKADVGAAKNILACADIVLLSGGEVEDGMNLLEKRGLIGFIKDMYAGGKRFIGMSAGSIMMGSHWVRWEKPEDDATAELFDCLGIVPAVFDTHAEDEDWKELKTVLRLLGDGSRGYGIPLHGMIGADGRGTLVNLEKTLLTYVNDNGQIRELRN
ncbi:MAG: Type 1 glutamine amidotransferase-like domain-containing protein [Oscillospiraceae bacterium]|nr:Type 1 glutamine amidotransferase-like domain-containing protein [Oscillospiraceae bacterium]